MVKEALELQSHASALWTVCTRTVQKWACSELSRRARYANTTSYNDSASREPGDCRSPAMNLSASVSKVRASFLTTTARLHQDRRPRGQV